MQEANPIIELRVRLNGRILMIRGRMAWALDLLIKRGHRGLTTLEYPAPRWSHYVYKLRGQGFPITTEGEQHGGAFAGTHARYKLAGYVEVIEEKRQHGGRVAA